MKFVLRVMETAELERKELESLPFSERMLVGYASREDYRRFLLDLYHVVKHFCPIIALALSRSQHGEEVLRQHLYQALAEERDHEKLVEEDLADLLGEPVQAELHMPSPPVRAMIGANYYHADRCHPAGVLGMMYVLEFIASCYAGTMAESLAESIPGSDSCFRFLGSHSSLDQHHVALLHELLEKIDGQRDSQEAKEAILASTQLNFYLFRQWMAYLDTKRG